MTLLLIDIGNTRLKWGLAENGKLIAGQAVAHQQANRQDLIEAWQSLPTPDQVIISCVGAKQQLESVGWAVSRLWSKVRIKLAKSQAHAFGVRNAYLEPETLGTDRWLALIAARQHYPGPVCIADCGTAVTVDMMGADGCHSGGLICPGITLMKKSLASGTEALEFDSRSYAIGPAKCTDAAIYNGTLWAVLGLIKYCLGKNSNMHLILTGGDAQLIAKQLDFEPIIDTDLVLRGLALLA